MDQTAWPEKPCVVDKQNASVTVWVMIEYIERRSLSADQMRAALKSA